MLLSELSGMKIHRRIITEDDLRQRGYDHFDTRLPLRDTILFDLTIRDPHSGDDEDDE